MKFPFSPRTTAVIILTLGCFLLIIVTACTKPEEVIPEEMEQSEKTWRYERDKAMRSPQSWLTISGLFWLQDGENSFGIAPDNAIPLPDMSPPERAGVIILETGKATVVAADGLKFHVGDELSTTKVLADDSTGNPDIITLNDLRIRAHNPPCAYTPFATCPLPPLDQGRPPIDADRGSREKLAPLNHLAYDNIDSNPRRTSWLIS